MGSNNNEMTSDFANNDRLNKINALLDGKLSRHCIEMIKTCPSPRNKDFDLNDIKCLIHRYDQFEVKYWNS